MRIVRSKRSGIVAGAGILAATLVVVGVALASHRPAAGLLFDGTTVNDVNFNQGEGPIKLRTQGSIRFRQAHIVRVNNALTAGWHMHPGPEILAVAEGTLTVTEADCDAVTIGPGEAYVVAGGPFTIVTSPTVDFTATHLLTMGAPFSTDVASPC